MQIKLKEDDDHLVIIIVVVIIIIIINNVNTATTWHTFTDIFTSVYCVTIVISKSSIFKIEFKNFKTMADSSSLNFEDVPVTVSAKLNTNNLEQYHETILCWASPTPMMNM
jgi:hypothetical protein